MNNQTLTSFCDRVYLHGRTNYDSLCRAALNAGFHVTNPRQLKCEVRDFIVARLAATLWTDKKLRSPTQIAAEIRKSYAFNKSAVTMQLLIASTRKWIRINYCTAKPLQRNRMPGTSQPNQFHGHLKTIGFGGRSAGRYIIDTVTIFKGGLQNCSEQKFKIQLCVDSLTSLAYFYPVAGLTPTAANEGFDYIYSDIRLYERKRNIRGDFALKSLTSDCGLEFSDDFKSTTYYGLQHNYSDPSDKVFTFLLDSVVSVLQRSLRQCHGVYGSRAHPNRITGSCGITVDAVSDIINRINMTPKPFLRAALARDCSPLEVTMTDRVRIVEYISAIKAQHSFQKGRHYDWTFLDHHGNAVMRAAWEYANWNPSTCTRITDTRTEHELVGIEHRGKQLYLERGLSGPSWSNQRLVLVQRFINDPNIGLGGVSTSSIALDESRVYMVEGTDNGSLQLRQIDPIGDSGFKIGGDVVEVRAYQIQVVYTTRYLTMFNGARIIPPTKPRPCSLADKIVKIFQ